MKNVRLPISILFIDGVGKKGYCYYYYYYYLTIDRQIVRKYGKLDRNWVDGVALSPAFFFSLSCACSVGSVYCAVVPFHSAVLGRSSSNFYHNGNSTITSVMFLIFSFFLSFLLCFVLFCFLSFFIFLFLFFLFFYTKKVHRFVTYRTGTLPSPLFSSSSSSSSISFSLILPPSPVI